MRPGKCLKGGWIGCCKQMKGAADRADNDDDEKEWLALDPEFEQSKSMSVSWPPLYDEHKSVDADRKKSSSRSVFWRLRAGKVASFLRRFVSAFGHAVGRRRFRKVGFAQLSHPDLENWVTNAAPWWYQD